MNKMARIFLGLGTLILGINVYGQDGTNAGPKFVCDNPVFDFGKTDADAVTHTFVIRNIGDQLGKVKKTRPSCGCTVANISKKEIDPGDYTEIDVKFNAKGRKGNQRKTVRVEFEDSPPLTLQLKGSVVSVVEVNPARVVLDVASDQDIDRIVEITSQEPLEITGAETELSELVVEHETIEGNRKFQLHIKTKPGLAVGRRQGKIEVKTNHPKRPVISVPVWLNVIGELSVAPETIRLVKREGKTGTQQIIVRPGTTKNFKITDVQAPDGIQVDIRDLKNLGYQIRLDNIPTSEELNGKKVLIKTDVASMSEIEIPFEIR
ncbi:MAG: DUF1573 domain-containing protein [Kiritimatiellae bacterium]|nr:DUF1573 domain-containing protein [Kiritimatiellia bacterium]